MLYNISNILDIYAQSQLCCNQQHKSITNIKFKWWLS